jgi:ferredoxin
MDIEPPRPATVDVRRAEDRNPEVDETLLCVDVHQETHDVTTFTARTITAELGVSAVNHIEESFDAAVAGEETPPAPTPAEDKTFTVEFSRQARTIEVTSEQTVLSCANKSGVRIPSSCARGLCGTCKSKLLNGAVDMKHSGGIRQREIDAGYFLPCCSRPLSNLVIDR